MIKQCKFYDYNSDVYLGGIMLENGDIICACCGCRIPADKLTHDNDQFKIIEIYENWVDFSETIIEE